MTIQATYKIPPFVARSPSKSGSQVEANSWKGSKGVREVHQALCTTAQITECMHGFNEIGPIAILHKARERVGEKGKEKQRER